MTRMPPASLSGPGPGRPPLPADSQADYHRVRALHWQSNPSTTVTVKAGPEPEADKLPVARSELELTHWPGRQARSPSLARARRDRGLAGDGDCQ